MTTTIDLSGMKALQAAYDQQADTTLSKTTVSSHMGSKKVESSSALQKTGHLAMLADIEKEILSSFPLRDEVDFFKETVHAYLESLGATPKPITARDISTILGYLIEDLQGGPIQGKAPSEPLGKNANQILSTLKNAGIAFCDCQANVNEAVSNGSITFDEGASILAQLNPRARQTHQDPLNNLRQTLTRTVLEHTEAFPDPVLRNLLLQTLANSTGSNGLLTKMAQASQKQYQNILADEYQTLATRRMFHDMSLVTDPKLSESLRAELSERSCLRYENMELRKAFADKMNAGKPQAEQKPMNDPTILAQYKDYCLDCARFSMSKLQTTAPVVPEAKIVPVPSAGPTDSNIVVGSTYRQNNNTCFMVSVANALASTQEGASYLGNWISNHPLSQSNPNFSAFENTLGVLYQQNNDAHWSLGKLGVGPDVASQIGLNNTTNSMILTTPSMPTWQHRDLWVNTSERLSQGEKAILFTDNPKHYRAVVGTWGNPQGDPGKDFGFILRDSLSQSDQHVTMGSLMSQPTVFSSDQTNQASPTQISFFVLATETDSN